MLQEGGQSRQVYLRPDRKPHTSDFLVCGGPLFSGRRSPGRSTGCWREEPSVCWALAL